MPSSQYVYVDADANRRKESLQNGKSSGPIHSKTMHPDDAASDRDETILEEDKDETILLSDEEEDITGKEDLPRLNLDFMLFDERSDLRDDNENVSADLNHHFTQISSDGTPLHMRGGAAAGNSLTSDPLTNSTVKSTTFNAVRPKNRAANPNVKTGGRSNTKERLLEIAERLGSDESDSDSLSESDFLMAVARRNQEAKAQTQTERGEEQSMSEGEFLRNIARGHAERKARLEAAESQQDQSRTQTQQQSFSSFLKSVPQHQSRAQQQSFNSLHQTKYTETQQKKQSNNSEETTRMGNRGGNISSSNNQSLPESVVATQPWEEELTSSFMMNGTGFQRNAPPQECQWEELKQMPSYAQNVPQKDHRRQEYQANYLNRLPGYQQHVPQKEHQGQEHQNQGNRTALESLPSCGQIAMRKDHSAREHEHNEQRKQDESGSLASYHQNSQQSDHPRQGHHTNHDTHPKNSHKGSTTSAVVNPYERKLPPSPPTKKATTNVLKISLEQLKSAKKSNNSNGNCTGSSSGNATDSSTNGDDTWQEEAFRSSLLDLLNSFPSNYFESSQDDSMDGQHGANSLLFATSTTEYIHDESPHSTTSQGAASAQLQRKRLYDVVSRSLARLAIASRHYSTKNNGGRDHSHHDGESPDFNPPSPRSLPSYMSVMNVHDDSGMLESSIGHWGAGNANSMLSSSKEVFCGQSVHGRNARTVRLSCVPDQNNVPSSNPFSGWTLEELTYGSIVLAAQVCYEASADPDFDVNHTSSKDEAESCRVAGFAQNLNDTRALGVSSALVESALAFMATAFACLESDFVYSILKSPLKAGGSISHATVFDVLSHFAPVSTQDDSIKETFSIPGLSLLALSRGLEATIYVARYATTLDPSSACVAYSSPHYSWGASSNGTSSIDVGIDEGGVGWLSALGRDLGLKLEDNRHSRPRHKHLRKIAAKAYDFILEYNPMIVDDAPESLFHDISGHHDTTTKNDGHSRGGLHVDTEAHNQGMDTFSCRQPSLMKDRMYAAHVEYLSSMIQAGLVSSWLTSVSGPEQTDRNDSNEERTVDRLCQKLFFIIETRTRLCRSTNQNTSGDSEAVCAASLSLLILSLPKHTGESAPSSLSTSFRQMGNSTGTLEDLFKSPLVKRLVEMGLSWQDSWQRKKSSKGSDALPKKQAMCNAIYILSDICMAGGSSLISSHSCQKLQDFLQNVTESICKRGKSRADDDSFDEASIGSSLLFLLQLHTGSPMLVRNFLRNIIEQSPAGDDIYASSFVGGLLNLCANESFRVSSCASSLFRSLIDGNPADRSQDRLSEIILNSFETDRVGSTMEKAFCSFLEATYSSVHYHVPKFSIRWQPRLCLLGDLLGVCMPSLNVVDIFASSLSDDVLSIFVDAIECDPQDSLRMDTLGGSANLSLLYLFSSFVNNGTTTSNAQQRNVKKKLIRPSNFLTVLEIAMSQGASGDMTHRALKLQKSLTEVRSLALVLTKSSNSITRKENALHGKLARSEMELKQMMSKYQQIESDRDILSNSFNDQRLAYERRLEFAKSEARMTARNVSEIHIQERKQAEKQYEKEKDLRVRTEKENEQLKCERSSYKSRTEELEALLGQELKMRTEFESMFHKCKDELTVASMELERTSNAHQELQEKMAVSEERVSSLTATYEDAKANLEDTCSKLVKLATIYQTKESEMDKCKAALRDAVNTANNHADTALQKYEVAKQQNKALSKQLKEVNSELKEIKAHRAGVQRMRRNAPVSYLNQLRNDPRIHEKKQRHRNLTGKENVNGN